MVIKLIVYYQHSELSSNQGKKWFTNYLLKFKTAKYDEKIWILDGFESLRAFIVMYVHNINCDYVDVHLMSGPDHSIS